MRADWIPPQLVARSTGAPEGDHWLHEIKYDGYRFTARRGEDGVRLYTRNGHDWTSRLPEVAEAVAALPGCYLDAELIAVDAAGLPTFEALQRGLRRESARRSLYLQVFDLLQLRGDDLTGQPLIERKERLEDLLGSSPERLRYVEHIRDDGPAVFARVDAMGLEGIVSKRADSRYQPGQRSEDWVKTKCWRILRFPVVGYTLDGDHLESLLLAHDGAEGLKYAGRVEFGLGRFRGLLDVLKPAVVERSLTRRKVRGAHWVRRGIEAEVRCLPWAEGRKVRHAVLQALNPEKAAA